MHSPVKKFIPCCSLTSKSSDIFCLEVFWIIFASKQCLICEYFSPDSDRLLFYFWMDDDSFLNKKHLMIYLFIIQLFASQDMNWSMWSRFKRMTRLSFQRPTSLMNSFKHAKGSKEVTSLGEYCLWTRISENYFIVQTLLDRLNLRRLHKYEINSRQILPRPNNLIYSIHIHFIASDVVLHL